MIQLKHLCKAYAKGSVRAVDDLTLHVNRGEIFGFIGPNGAGKTTTIKMLTGILRPDAGEVVIGGVSMQKDPIAAKRMIGYVPDGGEVYERLTGMEYLSFMADMYGVENSQRRERIGRYLEMFEMTQAAGDLVRSYSRGMRQKITLIGALIHQPALWVLDEPMVGLDPWAAHILKEEMRRHCESGNTVFFSTHVLDVAERLCDRIGIIQSGRLIAEGTMDELRSAEHAQTLESIFLEMTDADGGKE
ncbi:ATP-binding cassette domain-containing protein [Beduinella massiliensis]|uniref:ATP-binding cassette domain-containing protein n=1 Tax=Beduinella massiliensis TaxID=1852363 RepID=UPI000C848706